MKCAIVIPNWNAVEYVGDCLDALLVQSLPAHIIVVDNGSTDGSKELIRAKYPDVELIERDKNYGFTGGVIPGIDAALAAGYEAVALMNNDAVPAVDWLERLVATLESDPKIGIVAAKIRHFEENTLDSTGDFISTWGFPFPRGRGEHDTGQYDGPELRDIFAASGGASLYRTKMLREIGNFDQRFFAYYEDDDLSFRARLAGWTVRYEPRSVVRHHMNLTSARLARGGQTAAATVAVDRPSAFARYHSVKNIQLLYLKNMPGWLYWKYLPRFCASLAMMFISDLKRGLIWSNLRANLTFLGYFPGALVDRWHIQRRRQVSIAEIDRQLYHDLPPLQKLRFARFRRS